MQTLPYQVVTNAHWLHVYSLYEAAFDKFRRIPEIKTIKDNDEFCRVISDMLKEHLTVIPSLVTGVIEVRNLMDSVKLDAFVSTMLKSVGTRQVCSL
jgi:pyruvate dehydrogenase kinase 2/3/4